MDDEALASRVGFLQSFMLALIREVKISPVAEKYNFFDDHIENDELPRQLGKPLERQVVASPSELTTTAPLQLSSFTAREVASESHPAPTARPPLPVAPHPQHTSAHPPRVPLEGGVSALLPLLNDASVTSIECKGANAPLLINQRGQVRPTRIALNKEQIDGIIDEFSRNTRIPLVGGMLKAAFRDLLITAVVSEYSGSRFVIQKKSANFNPYAR